MFVTSNSEASPTATIATLTQQQKNTDTAAHADSYSQPQFTTSTRPAALPVSARSGHIHSGCDVRRQRYHPGMHSTWRFLSHPALCEFQTDEVGASALSDQGPDDGVPLQHTCSEGTSTVSQSSYQSTTSVASTNDETEIEQNPTDGDDSLFSLVNLCRCTQGQHDPMARGWTVVTVPTKKELATDRMPTFIATHDQHASVAVYHGVLIHPTSTGHSSWRSFEKAFGTNLMVTKTKLRRSLDVISK